MSFKKGDKIKVNDAETQGRGAGYQEWRRKTKGTILTVSYVDSKNNMGGSYGGNSYGFEEYDDHQAHWVCVDDNFSLAGPESFEF